MHFFMQNLKWATLLLALTTIFLNTGCGDDEEPEPTDGPIASFQFEVSEANFLQVEFSNFSQNADSYAWDFGDGNSSTEENPTHTYDAEGSYTVTLTASNAAGESAQRVEVVELTDPDAVLTLLTGEESKTWYLQREGIALGVGPTINDNQFFSLGGSNPLGDRPCVLDDAYTFFRDGTFEFESNGTLWIDEPQFGGWLGEGSDGGCYDEGPDVFTAFDGTDVSSFGNGGDYTYTFNPDENQLILNGTGAYIGLANKTSVGDSYVPVDLKEYQIFTFAEGDIADTLGLALVTDISWNFYLVSYKNPADLPEIPTSMPVAAFSASVDGTTVTFNNSSASASDFQWDFGDGNSSNETNPVHTYASEGTYDVTLTASNDEGLSDVTTQSVIVSSAEFTAAALASASGKTWRLAGANSFYVGDGGPGSNNFFAGISQEDVDARPCQFNDEFIFFNDGSFVVDLQGDIFAEDYLCGGFSCISTDDLASPFDVIGDGPYSFSVDESGDTPRITVTGTGAFIGFNKPINGGELSCGGALPASITYDVINYAAGADKEELTISIDISEGQVGAVWWTIELETND